LEEISFYFLFDGNFPELSVLEFKYLLQGIDPGISINKLFVSNEILIFNLNDDYLKLLKNFQKFSRLTSLTREMGLIYSIFNYQIEQDFDEILNYILNTIKIKYSSFKILSGLSFKVEMEKKGIVSEKIFNSNNRQILIFSVADSLIDKFQLKADLVNPIISIKILLTPQKIILGQKILKPNRKTIMNRTPSNRSYFHPGSMNPILIRSMVNLGVKNSYLPLGAHDKKPIFLDPFMGGGGMLIEAISMGYSAIGIELGYWMARGARMNLLDLSYSGFESISWSILRNDSSVIPLKSNSVDVIVTDPPYGHSTILGGKNLEDLLNDVLKECYRVLKNKSRMVISIPSTTKTNLTSFKVLEEVHDRVHNSLSRIIYILEK
jgi:putative methyltransferase (TIGR01177 family)